MGTYLRVCLSGAFVFGLAIGGLAATGPQASEIQVGDLRILSPHVTRLPATARDAAVFMTIINDGAVSDRLVGTSTSRSRRSSLMDMAVQDELWRMVSVSQIYISSNEILKLNALGKHVMLINLNGPLVVGETFTLVLDFVKAGEIEMEVPVVTGIIIEQLSNQIQSTGDE